MKLTKEATKTRDKMLVEYMKKYGMKSFKELSQDEKAKSIFNALAQIITDNKNN